MSPTELSENNPTFRLLAQYGQKCIKLNRPLFDEELEEFRQHPDYHEVFEIWRESVDKCWYRHIEEVVQGRTTQKVDKSPLDLATKLKYIAEDIKKALDSGDDPRKFGGELASTLINLLKALNKEDS